MKAGSEPKPVAFGLVGRSSSRRIRSQRPAQGARVVKRSPKSVAATTSATQRFRGSDEQWGPPGSMTKHPGEPLTSERVHNASRGQAEIIKPATIKKGSASGSLNSPSQGGPRRGLGRSTEAKREIINAEGIQKEGSPSAWGLGEPRIDLSVVRPRSAKLTSVFGGKPTFATHLHSRHAGRRSAGGAAMHCANDNNGADFRGKLLASVSASR
jgi:hypothetical protein